MGNGNANTMKNKQTIAVGFVRNPARVSKGRRKKVN